MFGVFCVWGFVITLLYWPVTSLLSRPQWRDLTTLAETQTLGSLFRRSFGYAQDDRLGCHREPLQHCSPGPLHRCYPDRSGGISRHWQRLRPWVLCSGDPSATLRMTDLGAIASHYNIAVLGRYSLVIPTRGNAVISNICYRSTISTLNLSANPWDRSQRVCMGLPHPTKRSLIAILYQDDNTA